MSKETPWIRCEGRLPEPYQLVVVLVGRKQKADIAAFDWAYGEFSCNVFGYIPTRDITHWMPLPPPPLDSD